jgi:L-threonylcarbamoyladenylate synthase
MTLPDPIGDAVRLLRQGGLVAYPTETVWGLAADASSELGVARLRTWKGRHASEPIAVLVESAEAAGAAGFELSPAARRLARAFWPGPLTLVVAARRRLAPGVSRQDGAVGLRCSSHPLAAALVRRVVREGVGPITATSLNRSGQPPARSAREAAELCGQRPEVPQLIDLQGAEAGGDAESTVIDTTQDPPRVLRWGAVPRSDIEPLVEVTE